MTPTSGSGPGLPTTTGPTHPQRGHVPAFTASTGPSPNHGRHRWPSPGCACGNGRWHRTEWGRGRAEPLLLALEGRRDRAGPTPPGLPGGPRGAPVPQHRTAAHTPCRPSPCPLALWVGVPVSECAGPPAGQCPRRAAGSGTDLSIQPRRGLVPPHPSAAPLPHPCPARSLEEVPASLRCQGAHGGVRGGRSPHLLCGSRTRQPWAGVASRPLCGSWQGGGVSAPRRQAHCCPGQGRLPLRVTGQLTGSLAAAARARAGQSHPRAHGPGPRCCQVAGLTFHITHPFLRH